MGITQMSKSTNGTTSLDNVVAELTREPRVQTPEQIAKAEKRAARKAAQQSKQMSRTIEGNLTANVVRVYVGETQALTMSFTSPEEVQNFIWMQLVEVNGPAVVKITR
jgi:hypothetical protein